MINRIAKIAATVLLCTILLMVARFYCNYNYEREYQFALKLCDDASLPSSKATYLREYRDRVATLTAPAAYILLTPDMDKGKQISILNGLITRLDDIASMPPDSLAYQQGMTQLSGQEINHQMGRISRIFYESWAHENIGRWLLMDVVPCVDIPFTCLSIAILIFTSIMMILRKLEPDMFKEL